MRNKIFFATAIFIFGCSLRSQSVTFSEDVLSMKPGSHELTVLAGDFLFAGTEGVRAMLYIPKTKGFDPAHRPLIVFYHGSTRDKQFYRTGVNDMIQRADNYGFTLLSVQNWWMLSGDRTEATDDSRRAANTIVNALIEKQVVHPGSVYATGFSAGGFTAMVSVLNSLDDPMMRDMLAQNGTRHAEVCNYAGFASFKGNYYPNVVRVAIPVGEENFSYPDYYKKLFPEKIVLLTVGGAGDAKRVREQAPEAKAFLQDYLGLPLLYLEFPNEGHALTEANWKAFWEKVEQKLMGN